MGREKEELLRKEENWKAKARKDGLYCEVCGSLIEYDDRDTYFSTKRCSVCENTYEKFERDD